MKALNKRYYLFVLYFVCTLLIFCMVPVFFATNQITKTVSADNSSLFTYDTIDNNVLFITFSGEQEDIQSISTYSPLADTYELYFNTGEHSVKEYYKQNSNNKLTVNTPILKKADGSLRVFATDKPRSYYLPYIVLKGNKYYTNSNGYFDYYLVSSQTEPKDAYLPSFFDSCTLVSKVFNPAGTTIAEDNDNSDGIISYNYAMQLKSQNSNYYVVASYQRVFREYELLCNIMSQAGGYIDSPTSDQNNNLILDSLSLVFLDGEMSQSFYNNNSTQYDSYYRGQLMWPHKINLHVLYHNFAVVNPTQKDHYISKFQNLGYSRVEAQTMVGYLYNMPKTASNLSFDTISISNANLTRLSSQDNWENFVSSNSTFCHEFGHILGLADLYVGGNDFSLVGSWSQMCNNPSKNSFFTAYEREKLGWLDANNIKEITNQGSYMVKKTIGQDQNNVVAYKVKDPTDESRYLYLEYRSSDGDYFDSECGNTGLLLYTINNTRTKQGNQSGLPYEMYVQRLSNRYVSNAALTSGQTISNIIFDYGGEEIDAGLTVTVKVMSDEYIVFDISGGSLENTERDYNLADFGSNQTLYNKLLQNLPQEGPKLSASCFASTAILDLSECNIFDLSFLAMFDLSQVNYINLSHNKITNDSFLDFVNTSYFNTLTSQDTEIILTGNVIDITDVSYSLLINSSIIWGIQASELNYINFQSITINYRLKLADVLTIKINGESLNSALTIKQISSSGYYELTEELNFGEQSETITYSTNFYVIDVVSKYPTSTQTYNICKGDEFLQDITDVLTVQGIDIAALQFDYTIPSTQTTLSGTFLVDVLYDSKLVTTTTIYYKIYSPPTVVYNSGKNFYVAQDAVFEEKGLTVYQDGQRQNYQMNTTLANKTYFVKGYYTGVTFDVDLNPNFDMATKVDLVDTTQTITYVVWYILTNQYGKQFDFYNQIIVTDMYIEKSQMNINIYNGLLGISGSNAVVSNAYVGYTYLNLVGINANSIRGLTLLEYNPNAIIDLSNNTLNDMAEILELLELNPNITIILIANKFARQDIIMLNDLQRSKIVFAVQNFEQTLFNNTEEQLFIADYYDDFSNYYSIISQAKNNSQNLYFSGFGQYSVTFENKNNNIRFVLACNYFGIINKNKNIIKEYSQILSNNLSYYFNIYGISENLLNYSSNISSLELDKIGIKNILFTITYLSYSQVIAQQVTVVDTTKPVISFSDDQNVYVTSLQDYNLNFSTIQVSATDEYDGDLTVEQSDNLQDDFGEYQVVYFATDLSQNTATFVRHIYIGKCEQSSNNDVINVNGNTALPIEFVVFNEQDFDILYKLKSEITYKTYTKATGIVCSQLGSFVYDIKLTHKYNNTISYEYEYSVLCKDIQGPTVLLLGASEMSVLIDANFIEPGIRVTDNYTQGVFDLNSHSNKIVISVTYQYTSIDGEQNYSVSAVDTSKVGTYTITYKAVDEFENVSTNNRIVNVTFYPVHSLQIDTANLLSKYKVGVAVELELNVSPSAVDPNSNIIWFVNGQEYKTVVGFTADILFDKAGEYEVYAVDKQTNIKSNKVKITIYSPVEVYLPIILASIVLLGTASLGTIYLVKKSKKRKLNVK